MYDPEKTVFSVNAYLYGLRMAESGGDYEAVNPSSGAYGAYQTIPKYLCYYYESAGQDPVNIKDPVVQDAMAEYHVRKHYARYGNWDLVSLAWHKGGSNADQVVSAYGGCGPAIGIEDIDAVFPGESTYINKVNSFAEQYSA
jgi:hypothetical protein